MEKQTIDKGDQSTAKTMLFIGVVCGIIIGSKIGEYYSDKKKAQTEFDRGFIAGRQHQLKIEDLRIKNGKQ
jgi:hypothetical protein